jgi:filamentous hemagglutinin family protein
VDPELAAPRWLAAFALILALLPRAAAQSITIDGTLSPAQTLSGPSYTIGASFGKQVGANLFHSFGKFGLAAGESAIFTGPAGIANIIGRVTGGSPSNINGAIVSQIVGANLFLINPFGIVFGADASVNVSGSFHASTADYLKLSDGAIFSATHPDGSAFSAAPPAAFGFLNANPPAIIVSGSNLAAPHGLELVGGPVTIIGATLTAPGHELEVTSVAGTGEVAIDGAGAAATTVSQFGSLYVRNSTLAVSDPRAEASGGTIVMRAGDLTIDASTLNDDNYGSGAGGRIELNADGAITVENDAHVHANARSTGPGGRILITGGSLALTGGSTVSTDSYAANDFQPGNAGTILVNIAGQALIAGNPTAASPASAIQSRSLIPKHMKSSRSARFGNAGKITVNAGSLVILSDGGISTGTFGGAPGDPHVGNAGNILINVAGLLSIDGSQATPDILTGISSGSHLNAGASGRIAVTAGAISIAGAGGINVLNKGRGGGGVTIDVTSGGLTLSGPLAQITASATMSGRAGTISITAPDVTIENGAGIATQAMRRGNGGNITLMVTDLLYLLDGEITTSAVGNGGNITIDPPLVVLADGSRIKANAVGGNGGNIKIVARAFAASADSVVTASSQKGISGTITITGQQVGLNGALVVLPDALKAAEAILQSRCAARRALSSFVAGGRGGLPEDPEGVLPALYLTPRAALGGHAGESRAAPAPLRHTAIRLTMRCV